MEVMIDLETLSTKTRGVITQIGAVAFQPVSGGQCRNDKALEIHVDIQSNLDHSRSITGATVNWWLQQDNAARSAFVFGQMGDTLSLPEALMALTNWPSTFGMQWKHINGVWANGPSFDVTMLETAFEDCGLEVPWQYKAPRCCRTLFALVGGPPKIESVLVSHKAVDDAIYQACQVQEAMRMLGK